MIYTGQDEFVANWVKERISVPVTFVNPATISIIMDDKLIAAAVFTDWSPDRGDIQIAFAADHPKFMTRESINGVFNYPFVQLACRRVTSYVPVTNKQAKRFNEGVGFKLEGRLRDYLPSGDIYIYSYLAKEFFNSKWVKHDERIQAAA